MVWAWMLVAGWLGSEHAGHGSAPAGVVRKTVAGQVDCGPNYLLPDDTARLGSHTFVILGKDGPEHIWGAHRSGTPPHNFQFIWRVRLDPDEMAFYEQVAARSSTLPAFTTIQYAETGRQLNRTFFCLHEQEQMVGRLARRDDAFAPLFPIHASLLANAQHEALFKIGENVVHGGGFELERSDVELVLHRYLPAYVDPDALRRNVAAHPELRDRLTHAPLRPDEPADTAGRPDHAHAEAVSTAADHRCPRNFKLPKQPVARTPHTFVLLGDGADGRVLAVHLYDPAPHNFQTFVWLSLDADERAMVQAARAETGFVLLQTRVEGEGTAEDSAFCMSSLRTDLAAGGWSVRGTVYGGATLQPYVRGTAHGVVDLGAADVEVLVNRELASFLDPAEVVGEP